MQIAISNRIRSVGRPLMRAGLTVLQLGDEAILHTREFNLNGADMKQVRQAVNRLRKQGYTVRIRRHRDVPEEDMAAVIRRADEWLLREHGCRP